MLCYFICSNTTITHHQPQHTTHNHHNQHTTTNTTQPQPPQPPTTYASYSGYKSYSTYLCLDHHIRGCKKSSYANFIIKQHRQTQKMTSLMLKRFFPQHIIHSIILPTVCYSQNFA